MLQMTKSVNFSEVPPEEVNVFPSLPFSCNFSPQFFQATNNNPSLCSKCSFRTFTSGIKQVAVVGAKQIAAGQVVQTIRPDQTQLVFLKAWATLGLPCQKSPKLRCGDQACVSRKQGGGTDDMS